MGADAEQQCRTNSIRARAIRVGLATGCLVGVAVAVVMTAADWRVNPGNLFHDADGPNWGILAETAVSWFVPVALLVALLTTGCVWGFLKRRAVRREAGS